MSAFKIHHTAPLGSLITYADGQPRPPDSAADALHAWQLHNGTGLLVRKDPPSPFVPLLSLVSITLRTADFGATGPAGLTIVLDETAETALQLEIVKLPPIGAVRILRERGDDVELLHLAENHLAADAWLSKHLIPHLRCQTVTADELAAGVVEGRLEGEGRHAR